MVIYAYSLPAIFAFLAKIALLAYAQRSPRRDVRTRLFVVAVVISMALNLIEIGGFQGFFADSIAYAGYLYNGGLAALLAVLSHLAVWTAYEDPPVVLRRWLVRLMYGYLLLLGILLATTDRVIAGFEWLGGYTITRVAGPLYPLFELFATCMLLTIMLLPIRGIRQRDNGTLRSRCQIWVLAAIPSCLLVIVVLTLLRLDVKLFNATVTLPVPMALLLAAIAYSVHNSRIIEPWSYFANEKRLGNELDGSFDTSGTQAARTDSVKRFLSRLADTLACPVYLIGPAALVYETKNAPTFAGFPFSDVRRMVVAQEVTGPLKDLMKKCRVGAIAPLFATSEVARSWLVFGEGFAARVHTPGDFRAIDRIVMQLAGLLLDSLLQNPSAPAVSFRPTNESENVPSRSMQNTPGGATPTDLGERLAHYEGLLIRDALASCNGNHAKAARLLGIQPSTLHYKLKRLKGLPK